MFFLINISSKSKESLKLFLLFLAKLNNENLTVEYFPKKKVKKVITVLKSPHVNKSAQEQFEFRIHTKKLSINSLQHLKFVYFLKKIQNTIFPFIKIKLEGYFIVKSQSDLISYSIEPNKLTINFFNDKMLDLKIVSQYFNLFDYNGEYFLKKLVNNKISIFSSVGKSNSLLSCWSGVQIP